MTTTDSYFAMGSTKRAHASTWGGVSYERGTPVLAAFGCWVGPVIGGMGTQISVYRKQAGVSRKHRGCPIR